MNTKRKQARRAAAGLERLKRQIAAEKARALPLYPAAWVRR